MTARCDGAEIPDHRALRIDIGGDDGQAPAALVLDGDLAQEILGHEAGNEAVQRLAP